MPDITVNIEVYCDTCGEGLCEQTKFTHTYSRNEPTFRVEACKVCMSNSFDEGYEAGYKACDGDCSST